MLDAVVVVWSMLVASCATLATVHLLVWANDRESRSSLAFVGISLAVAAAAFIELRMMQAGGPGEYASGIL